MITYAVIKDNKVINTIVAETWEDANGVVKAINGKDAFIVDITEFPVSIGFTYKDNIFFDTEGNIVNKNLTTEDKVTILYGQVSEIHETLANVVEILGGIAKNNTKSPEQNITNDTGAMPAAVAAVSEIE